MTRFDRQITLRAGQAIASIPAEVTVTHSVSDALDGNLTGTSIVSSCKTAVNHYYLANHCNTDTPRKTMYINAANALMDTILCVHTGLDISVTGINYREASIGDVTATLSAEADIVVDGVTVSVTLVIRETGTDFTVEITPVIVSALAPELDLALLQEQVRKSGLDQALKDLEAIQANIGELEQQLEQQKELTEIETRRADHADKMLRKLMGELGCLQGFVDSTIRKYSEEV
jgi:hypothetical protein